MTREEAVKWLKDMPRKYFHGGDEQFDELRKEAVDMAIEALEQPEQQWIPCSERLPKTKSWRTYFIVTTKTGFTTAAEWENTTIRGKEVSRWIWYDKICPFDVIAWMPLPAPMKGEKE